MICVSHRTFRADPASLQRHLAGVLGVPVRVDRISPLAGRSRSAEVKQYGYGIPLLVEFEAGGKRRRAVLETVREGPFGHEHMADRAQSLLWAHEAFNHLPRHAPSIDVGAFRHGGELVSVRDAEEFFILMEFVEGAEYAKDLERMGADDSVSPADEARADALCDYLAEIHRHPGPDAGLWKRRLRELLGHGECIMGLTDSYPEGHEVATPEVLERIERKCLSWRWRLRNRSHRLRQVHGDFHPWNILFRKGTDFSVLDRSRGEWGEPADDVTCLTSNYLFTSLVRLGHVEGRLAALFRRFWNRYLDRTGDREILEVAAPFFAFRGLVLASPVWYPTLDAAVRRRILRFIEAVLDAPRFDPETVAACFGE